MGDAGRPVERGGDQLMGTGFFSANGAIDPPILAVMSRSFVELKLLPAEQPLAQFLTDRFLPAT